MSLEKFLQCPGAGLVSQNTLMEFEIESPHIRQTFVTCANRLRVVINVSLMTQWGFLGSNIQ